MGASHEADYRAVKAVSASSLKVFRSGSPRAFKMYYEGNSFFVETPAMKMGTMIHCAILEPDRLEERFQPIPKGLDLRTKAGKESMEELRLSFPSADFVKEEDYKTALEIRDSVFSDSFLRSTLLHGSTVCEKPYYWSHQNTKLPCKALVDAYNQSEGLLLDIKTTQSSAKGSFGSDIFKYGYHVQAVHYLEAVPDAKDFLFVAVEKRPPYDFCVYSLSEEYKKLAKSYREDLMIEINACFENNYWPKRSEYSGGIVTLEPPKWMSTNGEQSATASQEDDENDFDIASL